MLNKNLNLNYLNKMLGMMVKINKNERFKATKERIDKYTSEIKQQPTFNKKLINQKQRLSPTAKSRVKPFKPLQESRLIDKWDIDSVLQELDND